MGYSGHIPPGGISMATELNTDEYFRKCTVNLGSFLDEVSSKYLDDLIKEAKKEMYIEKSSVSKPDLTTRD